LELWFKLLELPPPTPGVLDEVDWVPPPQATAVAAKRLQLSIFNRGRAAVNLGRAAINLGEATINLGEATMYSFIIGGHFLLWVCFTATKLSKYAGLSALPSLEKLPKNLLAKFARVDVLQKIWLHQFQSDLPRIKNWN
jgi:hypothetical protein